MTVALTVLAVIVALQFIERHFSEAAHVAERRNLQDRIVQLAMARTAPDVANLDKAMRAEPVAANPAPRERYEALIGT